MPTATGNYLEYVYFDFKPFGKDNLHASSFSDFLLLPNDFNCEGFYDLVNYAAIEIIQGLAYLHSQEMAHRDLKLANILVCNHHYSTLTDEHEIALQYQLRPIACKLTDFGESRFLLIQTQSLMKTTLTEEQSQVYMAPERLVKELFISGATISDFFLAGPRHDLFSDDKSKPQVPLSYRDQIEGKHSYS